MTRRARIGCNGLPVSERMCALTTSTMSTTTAFAEPRRARNRATARRITPVINAIRPGTYAWSHANRATRWIERDWTMDAIPPRGLATGTPSTGPDTRECKHSRQLITASVVQVHARTPPWYSGADLPLLTAVDDDTVAERGAAVTRQVREILFRLGCCQINARVCFLSLLLILEIIAEQFTTRHEDNYKILVIHV